MRPHDAGRGGETLTRPTGKARLRLQKMPAQIFAAKNSEAPIPNVETYDGQSQKILVGDKDTDAEEDQSSAILILNSTAIPWRPGSANDSA